MTDTLITGALTLLAILLAYSSFRGWQRNKSIWYLIATVASVLAAPAFWLSWVHGFFLLIPAAMLFALAQLFKKK